jgi:hypothetical protein
MVYIGIARPSEAAESIPVTNIFMSGIFVSFIYSTVTNGFPSGGMICVLWLIVIDLPLQLPILISVAADGKLRKSVSFESVSVTMFRWIAFNSFSIWFWYHGLDVYNYAECQGPRVFLFANLSATGRIQTYYKYFTTTSGVWSFIFLCIWVVLFYRRRFRKKGSEERQERNEIPVSDSEESETSTNEEYYDRIFNRVGLLILGNALICTFCLGLYGAVIGSSTVGPLLIQSMAFERSRYKRALKFVLTTFGGVLVLMLCILPVELQVAWNKLGGVGGISSTGQLISLTIGSFSLFRAVWLVLMKSEDESSEDSDSSGDDEADPEEHHDQVMYRHSI